MITTQRNDSYYQNGTSNSRVGLLERKSVPEYKTDTGCNLEDARTRMQRNLDKLLNYDSEAAAKVMEQSEQMRQQALKNAERDFANEDITPTSTTMQFGDDNVDVRKDAKGIAEEKNYTMNAKGKVAVICYTVCVAVIMALIIINTAVLSALYSSNSTKSNELANLTEEYQQTYATIQEISSDSYVLNVAENQFGMTK